MKIIKITSIALLAGITALSSCKKEEPEAGNTLVGGCKNAEATNYNKDADYDDESCVFAYVDTYEITYHPEKDESGSNWDFLTNTDADLVLKIKVQGSNSWFFDNTASPVNNVPHNSAQQWTAPSQVKFENKIYEWELWDDDSGSANDFISSGTFNPIELTTTENGSFITKGTNAANDETQLKIYYSSK